MFTTVASASKSAHAVRGAKQLAAGFATAAPRIGDTKVPMSRLESGKYINYQRIEDNLAIVRQRYVNRLTRAPETQIRFNSLDSTDP
jgi:aconitate hydratase